MRVAAVKPGMIESGSFMWQTLKLIAFWSMKCLMNPGRQITTLIAQAMKSITPADLRVRFMYSIGFATACHI